jgi:hypothetical protein
MENVFSFRASVQGVLRAEFQNEHHTVNRIARLTAGNGAEPFLPRGVPYLQLHQLVVHVNLLDLEINAVWRMSRRRGGRRG